MVSELRSRKLKSTGDKALNSEGKNSKDEADAKSAGSSSFIHRLIEWDRAATLTCSICASSDSGYLRYFFQFLEISGHGVPWIAIPVALMCYSADPWLLELLLNLLAGIFLDLLVSFILKAIVRRHRPSVNQNDMFFAVSVDNKFSFPSGHCTRVGMLAYFFIANLNLTVFKMALYLLWTVGIAASRLCLGRHYVTDVTCGILIGLLQGIFIQHYWMPVENFYYLKTYFT
ncbi:phospholipid phosphatase 6-like [Patiria miniata]|uniref:Phosphatidic acid phosphatase type 2/haloperoxidase domain-containing protein n=1 Tax=Patiria miniata TaxID=46514 RepID=A0A914AKD2_PATMI|nr:phospholipid phosphatase 6-like [Patiria miniata]